MLTGLSGREIFLTAQVQGGESVWWAAALYTIARDTRCGAAYIPPWEVLN